jgi:hypothetical protein
MYTLPGDVEGNIFDFSAVQQLFAIAIRNTRMGNLCIPRLRCTSLDNASSAGLVDILQWWKQSGLELRWSEKAIDMACRNGHVNVLQWWKDSGLAMKYTSLASEWAAQSGHTHVLQWMADNRLQVYCDLQTVMTIRHNGHNHVLLWFNEYLLATTPSRLSFSQIST